MCSSSLVFLLLPLAALLSSLSLSSVSLFLALLVSLSLSLSLSSFPLYRYSRHCSPFALTRFRGRRQLPQAGEVRRPQGGRRGELVALLRAGAAGSLL